MKTRFSLLSGLLCSAAMIATGASAQNATSLDEVVVTGSFIKRSEGFPSASPVDLIGEEQLTVKAPTNLSNFFADLPYNFGSTSSTGRALGGGERGLGTINLRGLGNAATLVLLNGHRQTQVADSPDNIVDVNSLVPEIMISRFEVLKDGASALYGTDAVAGVVNIITKDNFEGLTVAGRASQFTFSNKGDRNIQILGGKKFFDDKLHVVAAAGYWQQDLMRSTFDAPLLGEDRENLRYTIASGNPGRYVVPNRNAAGALLAGPGSTRTVVDPACGSVVGSVPTDVPPASRIAARLPLASATDCRYQFFDENALQSDMEKFQAFVRLSYEFSDTLRFTGDIGYTTFETRTAYTTGESISQTVVVPGTNPGNTFRAVNAAGQPLFAASSGVAAGFNRDGAPVFLPSRDAAGRVILSATPTVAGSGIPFYEDVTLNGRLLGSQCGLPTNNALSPGDCAERRASESENTVLAMSGYFNGRIADRWDWSAGASYSKYEITSNGTPGNGLTSNLTAALTGLGGAGCNGTTRNANGCSYFNPFGNSTFASTAGDARANSQALIDWVIPRLNDQYESKLFVAEGVISGPLFKLPAGDLSAAVGYQFRRADLAADYDIQRNRGNTLNLNTAQDFEVSRDTHAIFTEVQIPLMDNDLGYLEANGALRYERIGGDLETTNPKVGVLFNSKNQMLTLRASYGESFVAPSLFRLFGNVGGGAAVSDCPIGFNAACTGQTNLRITQVSAGNPDLKPQTSDAYSFGFTLRPFQGFTASLDSWHYNFEDIITTESSTNAVRADPTGALFGNVVRNATGQLSAVFVKYINAPKLETSGVDFDFGYRRDLDKWGRLDLNLGGTRINKYDLVAAPGGAVVKGAGQTNDVPGTIVLAPTPKWRANFRATYNNGSHTLTGVVRYYGELTFSRDPTQTIDSWAPVDFTYAYDLNPDGWFISNANISVGVQNAFDKDAPFVPFPAFQPFLGTLYDIRGRAVWARIAATF